MVDPVKVGQRFTLWPLHVTLLPWFEAPDGKAVEACVRVATNSTRPCSVSTTERGYYGLKGNLPVMKLEITSQLQTLHKTLLSAVEEQGWEVKGRYIGNNYTPHITQKAGRGFEGELNIDTIHIAEAQSQGYRQIIAEVKL